MRSFQEYLPEFNERGIRVAAISVDPPDVNLRHREELGLTYAILSDTNRTMLRRYDLLHEGAGPQKSDIAAPAEMLIDSAGVIRWANRSENATVRARPEVVLQAWDALKR